MKRTILLFIPTTAIKNHIIPFYKENESRWSSSPFFWSTCFICVRLQLNAFLSSSFRLPTSRLGTVGRYAVVESNAGFDGDNTRYQGLADRNARGAPVYQGMSA